VEKVKAADCDPGKERKRRGNGALSKRKVPADDKTTDYLSRGNKKTSVRWKEGRRGTIVDHAAEDKRTGVRLMYKIGERLKRKQTKREGEKGYILPREGKTGERSGG